ncbi:MAG: hypothetical protein JWO67_4828 [Streptosporangiaceae bacterium]|nr:hypothetical protein [Streptosporangiaceae bacterium]
MPDLTYVTESEVTMDVQAPAGLGEAGLQLWQDIQQGYELAPDERAVLTEACRTVDELDAIQSALSAGPVMMVGSTGQPRPSGLFAEARAHRLVLSKLLEQLALPAEGQDEGKSPAQQQASKAASVRWALQRERDGAA